MPEPAGSAPLEPTLRRDFATEKTVETGLRLQEMMGTVDAARFLQNHLVDLDVALRVLLRPAQRRRV